MILYNEIKHLTMLRFSEGAVIDREERRNHPA